jgi:hypothetical protein
MLRESGNERTRKREKEREREREREGGTNIAHILNILGSQSRGKTSAKIKFILKGKG